MTSNFDLALVSLYKKLKAKKSLKPSGVINNLFSSLVTLALSPEAEAFTEFSAPIQKILPGLHLLAAQGEEELERFWAKKVAASHFPAIELENYPYFHNYEQLVQLEYQALRVLGERNVARVLFIGSGPLPLAAILLARMYGVSVTCVDKDNNAVIMSRRLIEKLQLDQLVNIVQADALELKKLEDYDVVFLAALVGLTQEAKKLYIDHLFNAMRRGALLIIRTAHCGRRLLYPSFDERLITNFKVHAVIAPKNEVVNSVIIAEKSAGISNVTAITDKHNQAVFKDFSNFSVRYIADNYKFKYNPLWHSDLDQAKVVYNKPDSNVFLAYAQGRVVGSIAVRSFDLKYTTLKQRYARKRVAAVWRFFVDPEYVHTDLVRKLHDKVEQFAQKMGYKLLYAHDQTFVSGVIHKYISLGYKPIYDEHDQLGTVHLEKKI